ncbi:hypothetical protein BDZ90DRAFT_180775 [Jaminaea rosea]|uniref:Uncharacterized protein n=1 Tax=Jaminaea rosea TaxID=1569628 RepID=A0A316URW2_9BASI|nr:hypothetical protein BDZ90DRAFT_180775 [Jaminaea rosea]PWN27508.1 hypothetical protein BDZ90DRAFT_180775 [Jaminaea rosea]
MSASTRTPHLRPPASDYLQCVVLQLTLRVPGCLPLCSNANAGWLTAAFGAALLRDSALLPAASAWTPLPLPPLPLSVQAVVLTVQ